MGSSFPVCVVYQARTMGMASWLLCNSRAYFSFSNQLRYILNWCHLLYSLYCTCPQRSLRQFSVVLRGLGENGYWGTSFHWGQILCIVPWTFNSRRTPVSTNYRWADGSTSFGGVVRFTDYARPSFLQHQNVNHAAIMLGSTGLKWGQWKFRYWLMRIAICGDRNLTILKTRGLNFFFNSDLEGSATNMHSNQKLRAVSVLPWDIGEPSELAFWRLVAGPSRYALSYSKQSDQQSATFPVPSLTCMNQYLTYILRPCYKAKRITLFTVHVSTVLGENLSSECYSTWCILLPLC